MKRTRHKLEDILVENSKYTYRTTLKKRLIRAGLLIYVCSECNMVPVWNNKKLTLQIDHINGVSNDNRLENLRILCPNCHTQTKTYGGKNSKTAEYIKHTCPICQKEFERLDSEQKSRGYPIAYCSKPCSAKPNGLIGLNSRYGEERLPEFTELTCVYCSKLFKRKTNQARFKSENVILCSKGCVSRYNSQKQKQQIKSGTWPIDCFVNEIELGEDGYPSDADLILISKKYGGQSALARRLGICVQRISQKILKAKGIFECQIQ